MFIDTCNAAQRRSLYRASGTISKISAFAVLACLALAPFEPAYAENSGLTRQRAAEPADRRKKETGSELSGSGPIFAVISIADQRVSIYGADGLLAQSRVSTGKRGHATPTGVFSIVQKKRYHESNIYSGAPMPFMQRITWSGIALHAGVVPGYPASHGCIRLPAGFAQQLFRATTIGHRVMVTPTAAAPVAIAHANLPTPKLLPAPGVARAENAADAIVAINAMVEPAGFREEPADSGRLNPLAFARAMKSDADRRVKAAGQDTRAAKLLIAKTTTELRKASRALKDAENTAEDAADDRRAAARVLEKANGNESVVNAAEGVGEAEAALAEAQTQKQARIAKAREALTLAETALADAQKAAVDARAAQPAVTEPEPAESQSTPEDAATAKAVEAKAEAEAALAAAEKASEAHIAEAIAEKTEAEAELAEAKQAREARIAKATEALTQAEAAVAEAQKAADEMRAAKDAKQQELAAAQDAASEAREAGKAALEAREEATRRLKPLSVFISRKTGRLYVRQNFKPLFDAPVTIRDAEREIGTHLYVSTHATDDESALRWQAVTMPFLPPAPAERKGKRKKASEAEPVVSMEPLPEPEPETALGALDRLTLSEETVQRLAELSWVGAAVIISDNAMSGETGATTDFIITTQSRRSAAR